MDQWTQTQLDEGRSDKSDKEVLPAPLGDVSSTCVLGLQYDDFAGGGWISVGVLLSFLSPCWLFGGCFCH